MWLKILHTIGLTNLSDEEVEQYYKAKKTKKEIEKAQQEGDFKKFEDIILKEAERLGLDQDSSLIQKDIEDTLSDRKQLKKEKNE